MGCVRVCKRIGACVKKFSERGLLVLYAARVCLACSCMNAYVAQRQRCIRGMWPCGLLASAAGGCACPVWFSHRVKTGLEQDMIGASENHANKNADGFAGPIKWARCFLWACWPKWMKRREWKSLTEGSSVLCVCPSGAEEEDSQAELIWGRGGR